MNKKVAFEMYGDKQFVAVSKLKISEQYSKSRIEGEGRAALYESIKVNGVKRPIVINTYPGREGIIIDGAETFLISKELGIYDIPCFDLCVPKDEELEFQYLFSIACNELAIEDIIDYLKRKPYSEYFSTPDGLPTIHEHAFAAANQAIVKNREKVQTRKHSFLFRYDDLHKGYLEKLMKMLNAKSQNEALLKLVEDVVEGRIAL